MQRPLHPVGLLFVHGIGEQSRGETLLGFGEPIVDWLRRRGGERWDVRVENTTLVGPQSDTTPANTTLLIGLAGADDRERWLMAESFWARAFPPPSFVEVAKWILQVAPWIVRKHLNKNTADPGMERAPGLLARAWSPFPTLTRLLFLIVGGILLAPLLQLAVVALPVLALIPTLQPLAHRIQLTISAFLGDSVVLVESTVRFDAMVTQVRRDLTWLSARCERVVVIAHSQGAAVAHEVLKAPGVDNVTGFITLGSGIQKLHELRNRKDTLAAHAWILARLAGMGLMVFGVINSVAIAVGLGSFLIFVGLASQTHTPKHLQQMQMPGLADSIRWVDMYATLDPVPNGRLLAERLEHSHPVHNQHSTFIDHTAYWQNRDELVSRVIRELASMLPKQRALAALAMTDDELQEVVERRRFRVRPRAYSRFIVWTIPLAFLLIGPRLDQVTGTAAPIAQLMLFTRGFASYAAGWPKLQYGISVLGVFLVAYGWDWILAGMFWRAWHVSETERVLTRSAPIGARSWMFRTWVALQLAPGLFFAALAWTICAPGLQTWLVLAAVAILASTFLFELATHHPARGAQARRAHA